MTDYNDGKWHGWNGGECPVHPKSEVEVRWEQHLRSSMIGTPEVSWADGCWTHSRACNHIIAFRVTKPYREPREFWVNVYPGGDGIAYSNKERARSLLYDGGETIHVRKVINK